MEKIKLTDNNLDKKQPSNLEAEQALIGSVLVNNEILDESSIFFQWDHKPLVSGSISYPGSYLKHKANIYSLKLNNPKNKEVYISNLVEKADLRVWIFKKT